MLPEDVTAVAGVSRSGLSSAMQIAELLHLHAFVIGMNGMLTQLPSGIRFSKRDPDDGAIAIIDDTVATGFSMRQLKRRIRTMERKHYIGVTYASTDAAELVDFYAESLDTPHYLEWNLFNSLHVPQMAVDFDGILCEDCQPKLDDGGERYVEFLRNTKPKYPIRRETIPMIVTGRLEKWRDETLDWMKRWRIETDKLVMRESGDIVTHKARHYARSRLSLFVESCPVQAKAISELTGKRVICPASGKVWN